MWPSNIRDLIVAGNEKLLEEEEADEMHRYTSWSNNMSRSYKAVKVLFFRGLYLAKCIWGVCKAIRQLLEENR